MVVAISLLALLADSGEEDEQPRLAPPPETADPVPDLPRGWTVGRNGALGVAFGVPPGWTSANSNLETSISSPRRKGDRPAVVISISADRSRDAIEIDLEDYALEVAKSLGEAEPRETPEPGPGYEAAAAQSRTGNRSQVIIVRRPELAAYPMLISRAKGVKDSALEPFVEEIVASLRGRPVSSG